jgi:hypothetical protein
MSKLASLAASVTLAAVALAAAAPPADATVTLSATVALSWVDSLSSSGNCIRSYVTYAIAGYGYFRVDVWIENHVYGPSVIEDHWTSGVLFITGGTSGSSLVYQYCGAGSGDASHGHTYADALVTDCLTGAGCPEPSDFNSPGVAEDHEFCHWGHTGAC